MQYHSRFPLPALLTAALALASTAAVAQPSHDAPPLAAPTSAAHTGPKQLAQGTLIQKAGPHQRSVDGKLPDRDKLNASTVTVITAPVGGAWAPMGSDMARVLDDGENLRVLPIIGRGSVQNLVDVMILKGVDMGFMVADAMEFFKTEYQVPDINRRIAYIVVLYNNDLHIVARKEIKSVRDLAGKKIMSERNLGYFSVRNIFDRLKISADVDSVTDDALGLQRLLNGDADAWIVSAGKVAPIARNIKNDERMLHFVPVPYEKELQDLYLPSAFTSAEYPNLVDAGEKVETVASPVLLMVYNWPKASDRYNRLVKLIDALFSKIEQFHDPSRHPKWRDTSLTATARGWQRFPAAEEWLRQHTNTTQVTSTQAASQQAGASQRATEQERLFQKFLEWSKSQGKQ